MTVAFLCSIQQFGIQNRGVCLAICRSLIEISWLDSAIFIDQPCFASAYVWVSDHTMLMPNTCFRGAIMLYQSGFWISFEKKFRTWPKSANFAKFRPKFIFRLFLKILLNIFKLLFLKFSNFGGGRNHRISRNFGKILNTVTNYQ